jgi:hypothetical protein
VSARWTDGEDGANVDVVLRRRLVRATFAPIVALDSELTCGYRTAIRGPIGSPLEHAAQLQIAAARRGLLGQYEAMAFDSTIEAATRAKLPAPLAVCIGGDPRGVFSRRDTSFHVVLEFDVASVPNALAAAAVSRARGCGYATALRGSLADVAGLPGSPDLVIVDLHHVERAGEAALTDLGAAVTLIAEGLDTDAAVERARNLGARYGSGARLGRADLLVRAPVVFDTRGFVRGADVGTPTPVAKP